MNSELLVSLVGRVVLGFCGGLFVSRSALITTFNLTGRPLGGLEIALVLVLSGAVIGAAAYSRFAPLAWGIAGCGFPLLLTDIIRGHSLVYNLSMKNVPIILVCFFVFAHFGRSRVPGSSRPIATTSREP